MRSMCCQLCSGPHDNFDCPRAQVILRTYVGLPKASPPPEIPPNMLGLIHIRDAVVAEGQRLWREQNAHRPRYPDGRFIPATGEAEPQRLETGRRAVPRVAARRSRRVG